MNVKKSRAAAPSRCRGPSAPTQLPPLKPVISFLDRRGTTIRIRAMLFNNAIGKSDASEHVFGDRLLARVDGDVYRAQPWQLIPGPYLTLVQAVATAEHEQQGGVVAMCDPGTQRGWVASSQVAGQFCALSWYKGAAWVGTTPDDGGPPYRHVPITYDLSIGQFVGQNVVRVTVSPVRATWLITHVSRR